MEDRHFNELSEHDTAIQDTPFGPIITASGQQMVFERGDDGKLRFTTRVHDGSGWRVAAGLPNVLVGGASFDLAPSSYRIVPAYPARAGARQAVVFSGTGTAYVAKGTSAQSYPRCSPVLAQDSEDVEEVQYPFDAEVSVSPDDPWIHVSAVVHLERPLILRHSPPIEPEIVLWMSEYATMNERQNHEWRRVVISNPTRNCTGVRGNDFPAVYCYDPICRAEVVLYFDMTPMTWMSRENLARFEDYLCSSKLGGTHKERFGVGLVADHYHGRTFPAGDHVFRYSVYQRYRHDIPSQWDALATLIDSTSLLLALDRENSDWDGSQGEGVGAAAAREQAPAQQRRQEQARERSRGPAGSWADMASATLNELMHDPACQTGVEGVWGHPAYVRSSSRQWAEPKSFELMTQADVLWPLLHCVRANRAGKDGAAVGLSEYLDRLVATLPHFFREDIGFISNNHPHGSGQEKVDTWYFFENGLIKWPWIVHLLEMSSATRNPHEEAAQQAPQQMPPSPRPRHASHAPYAPYAPHAPQASQASRHLTPPSPDTSKLVDMFLTAFDGARRYAHNVRHIFPLFYDAATGMPVDSGTNYSVAGLYAYGAILGFRLSGREEFLGEARDALLTMTRLPLDLLYHEPQQFAFGALAALELSSLLEDPSFRRISRDLIRAQLRMLYWYDDLARGRGAYRTRGLFQACASILYPAFKENVESVLPWLPLLKEGGFNPALLRVLDLQRRNNFYYFDPFLPESERTGASCPHIPYENIGTLELPDSTGYVGKEIYGAGEVLWLYLMFEAFARASDPLITVIFLDLLDWDHPFADARAPRSVLVYNPTTATFEGTVDLTLPVGGQPCPVEVFRLPLSPRAAAREPVAQWRPVADWEPAGKTVADHGRIEVALAPGACCKLVVRPGAHATRACTR
ncbi:MAG: hypothetical protein H5T95_07875 [Firmicutes bacterium]|nr:hypothetical protein [Bacillota bacterium]